MRIVTLAAVALLALAGCSEDEAPIGAVDTGTPDTSTTPDTAKDDTSTPSDTAKDDTSTPTDTATDTDTDTGTDTATDTGVDAPTDTFDICTTLGAECNSANPCPTGQVCYGSGPTGFCAPMTPECGGFLMKMCAGGRVCLRASGSSLGYCATEEEKPCVCAKSDAGSIDGCSAK